MLTVNGGRYLLYFGDDGLYHFGHIFQIGDESVLVNLAFLQFGQQLLQSEKCKKLRFMGNFVNRCHSIA